MTALVETSYRLKLCPKCGEQLPIASFTSTRAKYCKKCLIIHKLELRNAMTQRSLERAKVRKAKENKPSMKELKKTAQRLFNKWIRERDKDKPCISCGKTQVSEWHAGHYWAQGMNGALRYNEFNVWKQCQQCNFREHGNLLNYRLNLVKIIGPQAVERLDEHHGDIKKYTREELEAIISKYKQLTEAK